MNTTASKLRYSLGTLVLLIGGALAVQTIGQEDEGRIIRYSVRATHVFSVIVTKVTPRGREFLRGSAQGGERIADRPKDGVRGATVAARDEVTTVRVEARVIDRFPSGKIEIACSVTDGRNSDTSDARRSVNCQLTVLA